MNKLIEWAAKRNHGWYFVGAMWLFWILLNVGHTLWEKGIIFHVLCYISVAFYVISMSFMILSVIGMGREKRRAREEADRLMQEWLLERNIDDSREDVLVIELLLVAIDEATR